MKIRVHLTSNREPIPFNYSYQLCGIFHYWHNKDDNPLKRSFPKNKSELFSKLDAFLQESGITGIQREHIIRESTVSRKLVDKIFRIPVPVSKCRITGLHPRDAEILGLDE